MGVYIPPSVRTVREDLQSSVVITGGAVVTALIGTALGKNNLAVGLLQELGLTDSFVFTGLGDAGPVASISAIRSKSSGGISYKEGTDFTFDVGTQTLDWSAATTLIQPFNLDISEVSGASSLVAATTYNYVITAMKLLNETGTVYGETIASNEQSFEVSAAAKQLVLSWTTVTGAAQYRIYRTTTPGDYTGLALLTTVVGEFSNTYTDTGTATIAGSPPGLSTFGRSTATILGPYDLEPAEDLTIEIDGSGVQTVTFNATRAARLGVAGTFPTGFAGGETISIKIDGGVTQLVTFTAGASTAADVAGEINALPLVGGFADVSGGEVQINSDKRGSGSSVEVVGGTGVATIGHVAGTTLGSGNVADIDAVTAAEVAAQLTAQLTGELAGVDAGGFPFVETVTPGTAGTVEITGGTAAATIGFAVAGVLTGNDATAGTALRRPALEGGDFYVDYVHVTTEDFVAKRFTSLTKLIAEYGLGSRLAIGGTLAMGRAGRGNAASIVVAMSVPDDTLFSHQTALSFLAPRKDIDLVCPLTVVAGIDGSLNAHCVEQSTVAKRRECLGITGTPVGTQVGDATTAGTAIFRALALGSRRSIVCHPWPVVDVQDSTGAIVETELDGWATAAAVAGRIQSLPDRAEPATTKQVQGIKRLGIELDEQEMDLLGAAGVLVIDDEAGQITIRDSVTTDILSIADSQININLADDLLRRTLRQTFRQFRGRKLLPGLLNQINKLTKRTLSNFAKFQLIAGFDPETINSSQNDAILTQIDVNFTYQPVFPVRVIEFTYSLDLTPVALAA